MTAAAGESGVAPLPSPLSAFFAGLRASFTSVFVLVLLGTYVGIAALAHDFGFSLAWVMASTVLVWAGPSQVVLISALGAGATLVETAIAVGLSCVRFLPMVAALLPLVRGPQTRTRELLLPAHFTAASMWVESFRLLPAVPHERRVVYSNGLGLGFMLAALIGCVIGYFLTASLPPLLTAATLFLTPLSFLCSTARNARALADRLALAFGLVICPLLVYYDIGLDLMWTGLIAGTAAYGVHRLRGAGP
jgi:predicted branched-subunit amino acid permease